MSSSGSVEFHKDQLQSHCRICGKRFGRGARHESKDKELIAVCFEVNTDKDATEVHPPHVCYACTSKMRQIKAAKDASAFIRARPTVFYWTPHEDSCCSICAHFRSTFCGGRPKKIHPEGRQCGEPISTTVEALLKVAGPSFASGINPSRLVATYHHLREEVLCVVCQTIVDKPVQLQCDHLACVCCIQEHIACHGPLCPGCQDKLDSTHFSKCTSLVQKVIGSLQVKCKYECRYLVTFDRLLQHEATCRELPHDNLPRWSLTEATVREILEVPLDQSLSADEEILCSRLVRRSAKDGKLVITTGGLVRKAYTYIKIFYYYTVTF